jgi:putative SOS response-associated peptidase YedK
MCGRINVSDNEGVRLLLEMLGMDTWPTRDPRYNIAPTQSLDVVQWDGSSPALAAMQWGIIPSWAKPGKFSRPLINARSETVREKPSFRNLIANQRVLIPINGYYEWHRVDKSKTPFYIRSSTAKAMFVAGIYQPPTMASIEEHGDAAKSDVCVLTIAANESLSVVHNRMPVVVSVDDAMIWIQPSETNQIDALLKQASNDALVFSEVSSYVNSSRNEGPQCIEAVV